MPTPDASSFTRLKRDVAISTGLVGSQKGKPLFGQEGYQQGRGSKALTKYLSSIPSPIQGATEPNVVIQPIYATGLPTFKFTIAGLDMSPGHPTALELSTLKTTLFNGLGVTNPAIIDQYDISVSPGSIIVIVTVKGTAIYYCDQNMFQRLANSITANNGVEIITAFGNSPWVNNGNGTISLGTVYNGNEDHLNPFNNDVIFLGYEVIGSRTVDITWVYNDPTYTSVPVARLRTPLYFVDNGGVKDYGLNNNDSAGYLFGTYYNSLNGNDPGQVTTTRISSLTPGGNYRLDATMVSASYPYNQPVPTSAIVNPLTSITFSTPDTIGLPTLKIYFPDITLKTGRPTVSDIDAIKSGLFGSSGYGFDDVESHYDITLRTVNAGNFDLYIGRPSTEFSITLRSEYVRISNQSVFYFIMMSYFSQNREIGGMIAGPWATVTDRFAFGGILAGNSDNLYAIAYDITQGGTGDPAGIISYSMPSTSSINLVWHAQNYNPPPPNTNLIPAFRVNSTSIISRNMTYTAYNKSAPMGKFCVFENIDWGIGINLTTTEISGLLPGVRYIIDLVMVDYTPTGTGLTRLVVPDSANRNRISSIVVQL